MVAQSGSNLPYDRNHPSDSATDQAGAPIIGNAPPQDRALPPGSTSRGINLNNSPREIPTPGNVDRGTRRDESESHETENLPEPTIPFQQMVYESVGKMLPIYGASLFRNPPSTFAPVDSIPVTPEYVIGPGDELLVQAWGQITLDGHYIVDRAGSIYIPQVGAVRVAGLPFAQITAYLHSQLGRMFRDFELNVNMGQLRSIQVVIVGQARRPGRYTVSSLSTLIDALFATGGPNSQGSLRHIELKRRGKLQADFDLYELLRTGNDSKDTQLLSGDVIYIPEAGPRVAVTGSVNTPAIYELKDQTSVDQAIVLAGGLDILASNQQVRIERIDNHHVRSVLDVALANRGGDTLLCDGDVLEFTPIVDRFRDTVTLRGNVAVPGRAAWRPGMRIHDLIPNKESLITRDYWKRRSQLGSSTIDYLPVPAGTEGTLDVADPSHAPHPALGATSTLSAAAGAPSSLFKSRNDILLSAPDIDWSYAVIERQDKQDLTTRLLPFNLGRAVLDGNESDNLLLEPGDVVTVFSKADINVSQTQQTRYVRLEGEFASSGVYSVLPGETLRQLVIRAGGLTPKAYLFGASFTRESARRLQQERLTEYINQLELQSNQSAQATSAKAISDVDTAAALSSASSSRALIAQMRQLQATGRIVLESHPDSKGADTLPDLSLEDGDRFVVPDVPGNVNVEGAVYNQNSFLYDPRRRVGDYIWLAGGANRDADKKREFVIRADGSMLNRQYSSGLWGDIFDSVRLFPGDTVVIPQLIDKRATLRNLLDISQIIGQFGLGAAAVNVLK
jgi:polysaccharide biosynthesis/export protein